MEWSDLRNHLTGLSRMATASADGAPHVSIVSAAVAGDVVWVATNLSSRKARNLADNPRAMLLWEDDDEHGPEVYVDTDVEFVHDTATKQRLWSGVFPYDLATFFGTVDNPDLVLLRLTPRAAVVQTIDGNGPVRRRWTA